MLRHAVAVVLGVIAFLVGSLAHQFARGFDEGVLASGTGTAAAVIGGWWVWAPGAVVLALAFVVVTRSRQVRGIAWLVFGVTVAALAVTGSVVRLVVGPALDGELRAAPVVWLVDGASAPLTWAIAGAALGLAFLLRRPADHPSSTARPQ